MHQFIGNLDAPQIVQVTPQEFVVVSRGIVNPGSPLHQAHDMPQQVCVGVGPVPPPSQSPAVDDVSHQIEVLGFVPTEELQQGVGMGVPAAQMNIADENRPNRTHRDLAL